MIRSQANTVEAADTPPPLERPRAVTIVGWIWLVFAGLRFLDGLLVLVVWKVGGLDRGLPFLAVRWARLKLQIGETETLLGHAVTLLLAQVLVAGAVAWAAFELLRLKPWARKAIQAAAGLGILATFGLAAYVYASTARMAALEGIEPAEVRTAGVAAAAIIALLGSAFFGITIWVLGRPAVRRAFENPA
jgi:hypothetical protein